MPLADLVIKLLSSRPAAWGLTAVTGYYGNIYDALLNVDKLDGKQLGFMIFGVTLLAAFGRVTSLNAAFIREARKHGITMEYLDSIVKETKSLTKEDYAEGFKQLLIDFTNDTVWGVKLNEKRAERNPSVFLLHEIFDSYLAAGRADDAFDAYDNFLIPEIYRNTLGSALSKGYAKFEVMHAVGQSLWKANHNWMLTEKKKMKFLYNSMLAALDLSMIGKQELADTVMDRLAERLPGPYTAMMRGRHYQRQGKDTIAQGCFEEAVQQILVDEGYPISVLSESKHTTYRISHPGWLGRLIMMKGGEPEELMQEMKMAKHVAGLVQNDHHLIAPVPFCVTENHVNLNLPEHLYFMQHYEGIPLLEMIEYDKQEAKSYVEKAVDFLALYHAKTPKELVGPKLDFRGSLEERLGNSVPAGFDVRGLISALEPVIRTVESGFMVPNKDAHPDNFLVYSGRVAPLDTERGYRTSAMVDFANLVDYTGKYGFAERYEMLKRYVKGYNTAIGDNVISLDDDLGHEYLCAVVYRALSYFGFFSSIASDTKYKEQWLDNGITAIGNIESLFNQRYEPFREGFEKAKESMIQLKAA